MRTRKRSSEHHVQPDRRMDDVVDVECSVTLNNGSHVLRFESTGQDLGNLDQVTVQ